MSTAPLPPIRPLVGDDPPPRKLAAHTRADADPLRSDSFPAARRHDDDDDEQLDESAAGEKEEEEEEEEEEAMRAKQGEERA